MPLSSPESSDQEESLSDSSSSINSTGRFFTRPERNAGPEPSSTDPPHRLFCSVDLFNLPTTPIKPLPRKVSHPRERIGRLNDAADRLLVSEGKEGWVDLGREFTSWCEGVRKWREVGADRVGFKGLTLFYLKTIRLIDLNTDVSSSSSPNQSSSSAKSRNTLSSDEAKSRIKFLGKWKSEVGSAVGVWEKVRVGIERNPPPKNPSTFCSIELAILSRLQIFTSDTFSAVLDLARLSGPSSQRSTSEIPPSAVGGQVGASTASDTLYSFWWLHWMDWLSSPIAEEKGDVIGSSVKERLQAGRMTMRRIKKVDLSGNDLTYLPTSLLYFTRATIECLDITSNASAPTILPHSMIRMSNLIHLHRDSKPFRKTQECESIQWGKRGIPRGKTGLQQACVKVLRRFVMGDDAYPELLEEDLVRATLAIPDETTRDGSGYGRVVKQIVCGIPCANCGRPLINRDIPHPRTGIVSSPYGNLLFFGVKRTPLPALRRVTNTYAEFNRKFRELAHPVGMEDPDQWRMVPCGNPERERIGTGWTCLNCRE